MLLMRFCKLAILALLMVLMPLRGMAAELMQPPSTGMHDEATHQMAAGADMSCCDHEEDSQSHGAGTSCEHHDCCAAFLPATLGGAIPVAAGVLRIQARGQFAAGFVPEHLDPPPLAL